MSDTRHDEALLSWLEAERADRAEAADEALRAVFARHLAEPSVPASLHLRLAAAATDAAARRRAARARILGLPRRLVERLAALLLLAVGTAAAVLQLTLGEAAGATLARLTPGRVLSSAAEGVFTLFQTVADGFQAAVEVLQGIGRLSGAAATVASSAPVALVLVVGLLVAALAFRLLRDLIATERGMSHVDSRR